MSAASNKPDSNQYGLKSDDAQVSDVYANRPGGEEPGVGPADAIDSSKGRVGAVEGQHDPMPASRLGRDVTGETDDKLRPKVHKGTP